MPSRRQLLCLAAGLASHGALGSTELLASSDPPTSPSRYPLFEHTNVAARLGRVTLGRWPTPVTELPQLAAALGARSVHVKRDDYSALPYGGGKARKLELLLGHALRGGAKRVVTSGGVGSHHAVATAIYAARVGLRARLLLVPQPPTDEVSRVLRTSLRHGAELQLVGTMRGTRRVAQQMAETSASEVIAAGGTSPLGNLAFVNAGLELAAQVEAGELPRPDVIVLALGTMGSAVGLSLGLGLTDLVDTQLIAVRASNHTTSTPQKLAIAQRETQSFAATLGLALSHAAPISIDAGYLGRGYAQPTPAGEAALRRGAELGLRLDPTYTAKAFAALLDGLPAATPAERADSSPARHRARDAHVLFWHSHSAHELDPGEVTADDLPKLLQSYAR